MYRMYSLLFVHLSYDGVVQELIEPVVLLIRLASLHAVQLIERDYGQAERFMDILC